MKHKWISIGEIIANKRKLKAEEYLTKKKEEKTSAKKEEKKKEEGEK